MIAAGGANTVASGVVILWTGASCPTGYARVIALDTKFLQANTAYNAAAGGASTHQHPSHSHSAGHDASIGTAGIDTGSCETQLGPSAAANHSHGSVTVTHGSTAVQGDAATSTPLFATLLVCQKD